MQPNNPWKVSNSGVYFYFTVYVNVLFQMRSAGLGFFISNLKMLLNVKSISLIVKIRRISRRDFTAGSTPVNTYNT